MKTYSLVEGLPQHVKGIFGTVSSTQNLPLLSTQREFDSNIESRDGNALLGTHDSAGFNATTHITFSDDKSAIGISMGIFFDSSILNHFPHDIAGKHSINSDSCNGMFVCAAYANNALTIVTDPFGNYPLYYTHTSTGLAFSSSIKEVLSFIPQERRKHRIDGVGQFICLGKVIDGGSIWEGVEQFDSACIYTYNLSTGVLTKYQYWKPDIGGEKSPAYVDHVVDAFTGAVEKCAGLSESSHVVASLSGGLDSRVIWSVLRYKKLLSKTVTHYMYRGVDFTLAEKVGKRLGLNHMYVEIAEDFRSSFTDYHTSMLQTTNGVMPADSAHSAYIYKKAPNAYGETLIDGVNINLERRTGLRESVLDTASDADVLQSLMQKMIIAPLYAFMQDDVQQQVYDNCRDVVTGYYQNTNTSKTAKEKVDEFYITSIATHHYTDLVYLQQHYNQYISPYFEMGYVNALLGMHHSLRSKYVFQHAVLKRYAPWMISFSRSHRDIRTLPIPSLHYSVAPLVWERIVLPRLGHILPVRFQASFSITRPSFSYDCIFRDYLKRNKEQMLNALPAFFSRPKVESYFRSVELSSKCDVSILGRLISLCSCYSALNIDKTIREHAVLL